MCVCVYACAQLGPTEETEKEKLLYFSPNEESIDQKLLKVGLSEALIKFTRYYMSCVIC